MRTLIIAFLLFPLLSVDHGEALPIILDCVESSNKECLSEMPKGFNFLKGYPLQFGDRPHIEHSYVFTKGTKYIIKICKAVGKDAEFSIFNGERKIVGSNKINGTLNNTLAYECGATGIYYIKIAFSSSDFCGNCLLAFSR